MLVATNLGATDSSAALRRASPAKPLLAHPPRRSPSPRDRPRAGEQGLHPNPRHGLLLAASRRRPHRDRPPPATAGCSPFPCPSLEVDGSDVSPCGALGVAEPSVGHARMPRARSTAPRSFVPSCSPLFPSFKTASRVPSGSLGSAPGVPECTRPRSAWGPPGGAATTRLATRRPARPTSGLATCIWKPAAARPTDPADD